VAVAPEELSWRRQLALFRQARTLVGPFGSGLHTALVTPTGAKLGIVGLLNTTQSEIGALCGHRMAYLTEGFQAEGEFEVPVAAFAAFLDAVVAA
jgi:capsular polysaccharide biosynthesis protein